MNYSRLALLASIIAGLTGCVESKPRPQGTTVLSGRASVVFEYDAMGEPIGMQVTRSADAAPPRWAPLFEGSTISYDLNHPHLATELKLSNGALLRVTKRDDVLIPLVKKYPAAKRDLIVDGLTKHFFEYDKVDQVIRFEPLRLISQPYSQRSYVAVTGQIKGSRASAWLKLHYYGSFWIFADQLSIMIDGKTTNLTGIRFSRNNLQNVWETAVLDLNIAANRNLVDRLVSSSEAIVRFRGSRGSSDLVVTDRMRSDMKAMLVSVDTINSRN
jgi:hypothetical protein